MSTILEAPVERSQTSLGQSENRTADSSISTSQQAGPGSWSNTGAMRCGAGNTLTQTYNHNHLSESFRFTPLKGPFDGLRIPPSPLHEF